MPEKLNRLDEKRQIEGIRKGLPMVEKLDQESLNREIQYLEKIEASKTLWSRWKGYWKLSGPGWLQSAITLGAGSAASSIFAGSVFGYKLLWVQPVSMLFGVVIFAAIGKQVLLTRARPYDVFWKKLHPSLALFWAINVLIASIVWQFPQYSLGTAVLQDIFDVAGQHPPRIILALVLLIIATFICWGYGKGKRKSIVLFERTLKYMVYVMILAFLGVVIRTGVNWSELLKGLFGFYIPTNARDITILLGALGAAVGVNMTFLYPYSLLARGWGKQHVGIKNFDLVTNMFIPFVLTSSLVIIATANTLHVRGIQVQSALDVARTLEPLIGLTLSRIVFSIGILSMCMTTMIMEMLIAGFVLSEMFHFELRGNTYKVATMVANIGILGAFYKMPFWLPVLASSFNLIMMPIAYICFFILQNRRDYLGEHVNKGTKGILWNTGMMIAILIVAAGAVVKLLDVFGVF